MKKYWKSPLFLVLSYILTNLGRFVLHFLVIYFIGMELAVFPEVEYTNL